MLKLDNGDEVSVKTIYMDDTKLFGIDEIHIDKIRVSNKYLYRKEHDSYKNFVFYERNDEYIPLYIFMKIFHYENNFNRCG